MVTPKENRAELAREFAAMVVDTLDDIRRNPDQAFARRAAQTAFVRRNYDWQARALEWQNWLYDLIDQEP